MEQAQVKTGPQLVLEQVILFQLAGTEEFYAALPPGMDDLREQGLEAYRRAVDGAMKPSCAGCETLGKVMTPFQNALGRRLAAVHRVDQLALEPLIKLITAKRGYRPVPVVLYYRAEDERITPLRF